jgi:hypothetical protein
MLTQAPGISPQDNNGNMTKATNPNTLTLHPYHISTLQALEVIETADARHAPLWSLEAIQRQPQLSRETVSELQTYIQTMQWRNKYAPTTLRRQLKEGTQPIRTSLGTATGYMIYKQLAATPPLPKQGNLNSSMLDTQQMWIRLKQLLASLKLCVTANQRANECAQPNKNKL